MSLMDNTKPKADFLTINFPVGDKTVVIRVEHISLLEQSRDIKAIVNAANCEMRGGGGINGAIQAAAGPELLQSMIREAPNGCATGKVVVTPGFNTGFNYIFHTPGPVWKGGAQDEEGLLSDCYWNCLNEANMLNLDSIGFCSISTGIYGYPMQEAANVAVKTTFEYLICAHECKTCSLDTIVFSMYTLAEYEAFCAALVSVSNTFIKIQETDDIEKSQKQAYTLKCIIIVTFVLSMLSILAFVINKSICLALPVLIWTGGLIVYLIARKKWKQSIELLSEAEQINDSLERRWVKTKEDNKF